MSRTTTQEFARKLFAKENLANDAEAMLDTIEHAYWLLQAIAKVGSIPNKRGWMEVVNVQQACSRHMRLHGRKL